jgi:hypothetical protein
MNCTFDFWPHSLMNENQFYLSFECPTKATFIQQQAEQFGAKHKQSNI